MVLSAIIIGILAILTFYPYILKTFLRIAFRKNIKSLQVNSYSSVKNISITTTQGTFQISLISFSITNSKIIISVHSFDCKLNPKQSSNSVSLSSTRSLFLRLFLSIFSQFIIIKLENCKFSINDTKVSISKLVLYMNLIEPSGSIDTIILVTKCSVSNENFFLNFSRLNLKFSLPGIISFQSAYKSSAVTVTVGKLNFQLIKLQKPSNDLKSPPPSFPGNIQLAVHQSRIQVFDLITSIFSLNFELIPLKFKAGLITGVNSIHPAIHIPNFQISEDDLGIINIQTEYFGFSVPDVLPVIFKLIGSAPQKSEKKQALKPISIQIDTIEARFPNIQDSLIEFSTCQLYLHGITELSVASISIPGILNAIGFRFQVSDTIEVSTSSIDLRLNEGYLQDIVTCIATIFRENFTTPQNPEKKTEKKTVNLAFDTISAYAHYADNFKILITVDKFTANLNPRSFNLFFFNSNIYDMETRKLHIISTSICRVNKFYNEGVANISVIGEEIGIYLPRNFYLARSVLKFLKGSFKVYKWCKFAFLQTQKSSTYIAERASLELKFKKFKFLAEDDAIDLVHVKKFHINSNENVFSQLLNMRMDGKLLSLTCSSALVRLNNFELDNIEKLRKVIQDLDDYQMPYNDFFAVILAYDFTCVGRKVCVNIRDYPYEICKIRTVKFGGRSILTKNRILVPIWAQYKHHSAIEVNCVDVTAVGGICMLKVLVDILQMVKYIFILKSNDTSSVQKLDLIDFLRYFLHGTMKVTISGLRTMILRTPSPYVYEYFNFDIGLCEILSQNNLIEVGCKDLLFYIEDTCIMNLPNVSIKSIYNIMCNAGNHWIITNNINEKLQDFTCSRIDLEAQVIIIQSEKRFSIYYHLVDSVIIDDFLSLHTNPPVFLLPYREKSPGRFFKKFGKIVLKDLKVCNLEIFLIMENEKFVDNENSSACLKIPTIHLSAECTRQYENILVPFIVNNAHGTCCNTVLVQHKGSGAELQDLLKCFSIEYNYSNTENHSVIIEGFEVFICNFFINLIAELIISQPGSMKKLMKKKREITKKWGIKLKKTTGRRIMKGFIIKPTFTILSEEDESRVIIKGGEGEFFIFEENLKFDTLHKDTKKKVNFLMRSIECFVDQRDETLSISKIFDSKDICLNLTYFVLPFNEIDFARNCTAADEFVWYKEKRVNLLEIELPEVNSSIESEDFWVLMDIIKGYIGFIPKNQVSFSDRMMEDEFKIFGGKELVRLFNENIKKNVNNKPNESKVVLISLKNLNVTLKKSLTSIIELNLLGFHFQINTFNDNSCQKSLEIHKITMSSGNTIMISPLLLENEEYLNSNTMITLRILDRWVKGSEVFWPIIDHLEFLVFPLNINFSKEIYKELYAFFFNEEKECKNKGRQKRIKLPRLYRYVHLNEIKICISVTGWIPLNRSKITLKAFTRQNKFKTLQGVFDKIMKHELKTMISQVPSICIQNLGISKKNFLPSTDAPLRTNSFFDKLKRNKSAKAMTELDFQKKEGIKLMFGKDFK